MRSHEVSNFFGKSPIRVRMSFKTFYRSFSAFETATICCRILKRYEVLIIEVRHKDSLIIQLKKRILIIMITLEYLRQFKAGPFAIFDTVISYVGILIFAPILSWLAAQLHIRIPTSSWLWFTMPISVIFHLIVNQLTPLMKVLANPGHFTFYIALFTLIAMTYMGLRGISKI